MVSTSTTVRPGTRSDREVLAFDSYDGLHFYKVPVVIRDDYVIYLEQVQAASLIHCTVHRWSARVREALRRDFNALLELHGGPLFAQHTAGDEKHQKFLLTYGFHPTDVSFTDNEGKLIEIYSTEAKSE